MRQIPDLEFYNRLCPRRVRGWNVVPRINTGACTRTVFPDWTREDHREAAVLHAEEAAQARKSWHRAINRAVKKYGDQGPLISGGLREHWPRQAKNAVRRLAHATGGHEAASQLHWKAAGYSRRWHEAWIGRHR